MRGMLAGIAPVLLMMSGAAFAAGQELADQAAVSQPGPSLAGGRVALAIAEEPHPAARTTRGLIVDGPPLLAYRDFLAEGGPGTIGTGRPLSVNLFPAAFEPAAFPLMDAPMRLPVPDPAMFADTALSGATDAAADRRQR